MSLRGQRAFADIVESPLPGRLGKPRTNGYTMVIDKGLGLSQTRDLLEVASEYIDFVKLTFGTGALYGSALLRAKIDLIRSHGVEVYPGGTFLEVAADQGVVLPYMKRAKELGFTYIEVSDGTISLSQRQRDRAIQTALELGFKVITEVGKKENGSELEPEEALWQIKADLKSGAEKVIVEGRESGKGAGLYDREGQIRQEDLQRLITGVPDPSWLMWEAPLKGQQVELIARLGPNVNLGNIQPDEVFALEALRQGLRGDTLRLALGTSQASGVQF